jgi:type I site-specific restriction endonuclease
MERLPKSADEFIGFPVILPEDRFGRPKLTDEEKRISHLRSVAKYTREHREQINARETLRRKTFRDPTLPLEEIREGVFRCTVCLATITSHKTFKLHAKTKKHEQAIEYFASRGNTGQHAAGDHSGEHAGHV